MRIQFILYSFSLGRFYSEFLRGLEEEMWNTLHFHLSCDDGARKSDCLVFAGRKDLLPHQAHLCQPVSIRALEVIVQSQRNVLCGPGGQVLQMHSEARPDSVHPIRSELHSCHHEDTSM